MLVFFQHSAARSMTYCGFGIRGGLPLQFAEYYSENYWGMDKEEQLETGGTSQ
jgi:hypothetical protein